MAIQNHTVKAGETLKSIAAKYKTTPAAIAKLNDLQGKDFILQGRVIKIPPALKNIQKKIGKNAGKIIPPPIIPQPPVIPESPKKSIVKPLAIGAVAVFLLSKVMR